MSEFVFATPAYGHLFWLVAAFVALLVWFERRGRHALERFAGPALLERLVVRTSGAQRGMRIALLGLCGVFSVLALMRPQWGVELVETPRVGAEIMICLDVSKSMLAEDAVPNRLGRAKADIGDLLSYLDGDQVGLIAFAGRASVLSPLTPDFGFLRLALDNAGPNSVRRGGTRLEEPIRKAVQGFAGHAHVSRSIILITDGEDHDSFPLEAAKLAAERGIRILAVGIGDEAGSAIHITDPRTGARRRVLDEAGRAVISRLDGELLRELALVTDGAYIPAGTGALDLGSIFEQHIAPLTRGQLDGSTRTIRQDAYQWALLAAALCLLASTLVNARVPARILPLLPIAALVLAEVVALAGPLREVRAQGPTATPAPEHRPPPQTTPVPTPEAVPPPAPNTSARALYNEGLAALGSGALALAKDRLERARAAAGTDVEVRFRATYALGTAAVHAADAQLEGEPESALAALREAANRYRGAIELRSGAEDARYNLELVERRITALADQLDRQEQGDLKQALEALIDAQRAVLGEIGDAVQIAQERADVNTTEQARATHRALSVRQLAIMDQSRRLAERVARDLAALDKSDTDTDASSDEEALRQAQLEGLSHYLQQARERFTRLRARLRRVQSEAAYRRAAAALDALKEGRDQLLDPAARLATLVSEQRELMVLSLARAAPTLVQPDATQESVENAPTLAPAWATDEYLSEAQGRIGERTHALRAGLAAANERIERGEAANPPPAALASILPRAVTELTQAVAALERASAELASGNTVTAVRTQGEGYRALADTLELFLDLKRLIEFTYQNQRQVAALLAPPTEASPGASNHPDVDSEHHGRDSNERTPADTGQDSQGADRESTTPSLGAPLTTPPASSAERPDLAARTAHAHAVHERNLTRMDRLGELLADSLAEFSQSGGAANRGDASLPGQDQGTEPSPEQQRLEQGYEHWRLAQAQMHRASAAFEAAASAAARASERGHSHPPAAATTAVTVALEHLETLRRLFFSLVEHLRETTERQQALNDDTEAHRVLDAGERKRTGPLAERQQHLNRQVEAITSALHTQAEQARDAHASAASSTHTHGAGAAPDTAGEQSERLERATHSLTAAHTALTEAASALGDHELAPAREAQDTGLEKLIEALANLQPPPPEAGQDDGEQGNADQGEQPQDANALDNSDQGESEKGSDNPPGTQNLQQLLQGVREREADRRRRQADGPTGYAPVEKDW